MLNLFKPSCMSNSIYQRINQWYFSALPIMQVHNSLSKVTKTIYYTPGVVSAEAYKVALVLVLCSNFAKKVQHPQLFAVLEK